MLGDELGLPQGEERGHALGPAKSPDEARDDLERFSPRCVSTGRDASKTSGTLAARIALHGSRL